MVAKQTNQLNLVGTAGEYYVCAEMCRRGFLALMTPKNNPLFDLIVSTLDGSHAVSVQVKTRSIGNNQGWKFGRDIASDNQHEDLFVVLVNLKDEGPPDFYIYEYAVLAQNVDRIYRDYMSKPKKDGSPRKDVGFRWFDEVSFSDDDLHRRNNWEPIIAKLTRG